MCIAAGFSPRKRKRYEPTLKGLNVKLLHADKINRRRVEDPFREIRLNVNADGNDRIHTGIIL